MKKYLFVGLFCMSLFLFQSCGSAFTAIVNGGLFEVESSSEEGNGDNSDTSIATSGSCGDNATWSLDSAGLLTISGTGAMTDWDYYTSVPWYDNKSSIKTVLIKSGITSIGEYAFCLCDSLATVTIPDSVTRIGSYAFSYWTSAQTINIETYTSAPSGWDTNWNYNCSATINWGQ